MTSAEAVMSSSFLQPTKTISGSASCQTPDSCVMKLFVIKECCFYMFPSVPILQAPLDFVLRGCLEHDDANEEIGLELIPGYALNVFRLQCLCLYPALSISDPIVWIVFLSWFGIGNSNLLLIVVEPCFGPNTPV